MVPRAALGVRVPYWNNWSLSSVFGLFCWLNWIMIGWIFGWHERYILIDWKIIGHEMCTWTLWQYQDDLWYFSTHDRCGSVNFVPCAKYSNLLSYKLD
jgi:hypothetical protein